MNSDIDGIIQYYISIMIIVIIYGFFVYYIKIPNLGIYIVWLIYVFYLLRIDNLNPIKYFELKINPRNILLGILGSLLALLQLIIIITIMISINVANLIKNTNLIVFYDVLFGLVTAILVSSSEEIVFRAYPIKKFKNKINESILLMSTSLIFSLLHLFNKGYNWRSFLFLFLAGIFLGKLFLDTKTAWINISFHFIWNFTEGYIFGLPISGTEPRTTVYKLLLINDSVYTGGFFGIESSIISIFVMGLFLLSYILAKKLKFLK